jgi:exonuclease III
MFYSGVDIKKSASAGVALLVNKSWKNKIHCYTFISERMTIRLRLEREYLTLFNTYAPEEGREEETIKFYKILQNIIDKVNKNDYIILAGDFNARVGNTAIQGVAGTMGEPVLYTNGQNLTDFASYKELKITNTFLDIKITTNLHGVREEAKP